MRISPDDAAVVLFYCTMDEVLRIPVTIEEAAEELRKVSQQEMQRRGSASAMIV